MTKRSAKISAAAAPKADTYERITAHIVAALEQAKDPTEWPWIRAAKAGAPINVASKKGYRGINRMVLGMAMDCGASRYWGTFRQWTDKGASVRKGSKGTLVTFWGDLYVDAEGRRVDRETPGARKVLYAKGATLFSADQVDGWTAPEAGSKEAEEMTKAAGAEAVDDLDAWIGATHAEILVDGDRAFYAPGLDRIQMPARIRFKDTETASATEHYYGVLLHELTHWTGHAKRCDRLKGDAFGSEGYAREELVAEIGSAFLSADLGIVPQPRADNASYVANWLTVLRNDKRAIFTASTAATKAAEYLHGLQPQQAAQEADDEAEAGDEEPAALAA